ncbi:polysaccharide biosynthesis/export family protein [Flavobacterium amniphilum]|uniref:polysaccharide biosynthesis/export family protein n=1 Tax=Flavobacterium amniphilum TaxID=1834035 RepID=UPI00202A5D92|nr:polysaccharide biosynthesis/export family protein [Flavobacterium amniphilum]MCL9805123.1 polysaccharide biosynthesis/export family protein [Flavobacterium amniphilum]
MIRLPKIVAVFLLMSAMIGLNSCSQQKNIAYFQNIDHLSALDGSSFEPTIQPDDLLLIIVSAPDPEAAAPFNLTTENIPTVNGQAGMAQRQQQLYLVDKKGMIDFPILGQMQMGGLTKDEVVKQLKDKLLQYIKNPIVNIRIMNYKVTVQGEVNRPGTYPVNSERVTLIEALSMAGDLTIYGKRNNVVVVREVQGKKTVGRIDITKADFINSPYYYLSQNDMVYVEPNGAKSSSSTFNQNTTVWISIASLISSAVFSILLINKN